MFQNPYKKLLCFNPNEHLGKKKTLKRKYGSISPNQSIQKIYWTLIKT